MGQPVYSMKIFSEKQYCGVSVSPGFGEGKAYVMCPFPGEYRAAASLAPADETERFYQARECYCRQVGQQVRQLEGSVSQEAVQILLLQQALAWDKSAELQICDLLEQGCCVESAVDRVWTGLGDSVPERYADFEDVRRGLLHALAGVQTYSFLKAIPEKTVLITEDLSPAMVAHLNPKRISAVLCQSGGSHSHGAILIRAMEIPCIMQLPEILKVPAGTDILCDASAGQVIAAPRRDSRICFYKAWQRQCVNPYPSASDAEEKLQTADGSPMQILCNVSSAEEVQAGVLQGAAGVGLFRTEFLFAAGAPDENIQVWEYKKAASYLPAGQPLCIRTLDPSRDKTPDIYTGQRGIRFCLAHSEQFKIQLRAVLRAAAEYNAVRLLLPMVTDVKEVEETQRLIKECRGELAGRGYQALPNLPVGVMIETPAAVFAADKLAAAADFFSIGSGDLTQYTMACSRSTAGEDMYTALPVLRAIRHAAAEAKFAKIPCHFCGDAAADADMLSMLLSFGIPSFSVCPPLISVLRREFYRMQGENSERRTDYGNWDRNPLSTKKL